MKRSDGIMQLIWRHSNPVKCFNKV